MSEGYKITIRAPAGVDKPRNTLQILREEYLEYRGRLLSDISLGLIPKDTEILDEGIWLQQNYPQFYVNNCQQMLQ